MTANSERDGYPLGRAGRVLLTLWSLFLLTGFAVAGRLEPDPRGFGTHQRLGLPPCSFMDLFAIPCPSCGMTTSFANFMRGRFVQAAHANVAGLLLAVVCAVQIPWCWKSVYSGRLWKITQPDVALLSLLLTLSGICLAQWILRVFVL